MPMMANMPKAGRPQRNSPKTPDETENANAHQDHDRADRRDVRCGHARFLGHSSSSFGQAVPSTWSMDSLGVCSGGLGF